MRENGSRVTFADYRHPYCGRVLFSGVLTEGSRIRMRCPKCNKMVLIDTRDAHGHSVVRAVVSDDLTS